MVQGPNVSKSWYKKNMYIIESSLYHFLCRDMFLKLKVRSQYQRCKNWRKFSLSFYQNEEFFWKKIRNSRIIIRIIFRMIFNNDIVAHFQDNLFKYILFISITSIRRYIKKLPKYRIWITIATRIRNLIYSHGTWNETCSIAGIYNTLGT